MMAEFIFYTFLITSIFSSGTTIDQTSPWELKKNADGIEVYTRHVDGSSIKEFRAVGTLPVAAEQILAVLKDVENYPDWVEDVQNSKMLNKGEQALSFYYQLNMPWPVKNRDMVLDMDITNTADSIVIKLTSNNKLEPEHDGFIRMYNVVGQWSLYRISSTSTQVAYQFLADPEGSIPAWVVNVFIVEGPYKSMKNLSTYAIKYSAE